MSGRSEATVARGLYSNGAAVCVKAFPWRSTSRSATVPTDAGGAMQAIDCGLSHCGFACKASNAQRRSASWRKLRPVIFTRVAPSVTPIGGCRWSIVMLAW